MNPGKEYEKIVADIHKEFGDYANITTDERILGLSGELRQIDVAIRKDILGTPILLIIECKDYGRRVEVGKVDELIGKMQDVGANGAILMSDSGFTKTALSRAHAAANIHLCSVIDSENAKLRAAVKIPLTARFFQVMISGISFQLLKFNPEMNRGVEDIANIRRLKEYFSRHTSEFYDGIDAHLNNRQSNNPKPGPATYEHIFEINEHVSARLIFSYSLNIDAYINDNITNKGRGVFNHTLNKMTLGKLEDVVFEHNLLRSTWQHVKYNFKSKSHRTQIERRSFLGERDRAELDLLLLQIIEYQYS